MKNSIKYILKYVGTFVGMIALFNLLLFLVSLIPSENYEKNVLQSSETLTENGPYLKVSNPFDVYINTYTDSVIVNEIYSIDSKHPYESYMKARKNYKEGQTLTESTETTGEGVTANYSYEDNQEHVDGNYDSIGELKDFLDGTVTTSLTYGRYWHGYLVLFRPLFLLFSIKGIRIIQFIVFVALLAALSYLILKKIGKLPAIVYFASLVCGGYISVAYSLESGSIFFITMVASIILLCRIEKIKDINYFLFVVGMIANYVDYLTVPLISLGIPLSIWLLYKYQNGEIKKPWLQVIISSIVWFAGYALTWIFKWIQYDLTIAEGGMLQIGFGQSFYRMNRDNPVAAGANIIATIIDCLGKAAESALITMAIMMFVGKAKGITNNKEIIIAFLLVAFMPIAWYLVLANHTILHSYFVYRHALLFMLGMLLTFYCFCFQENVQKK